MIKRIRLPAAIMCLFIAASASASQTENPVLTLCADHFPRFYHYDDTSQPPYGSSVDLMQELALRSGFTLAFTPKTHLARCLRLMSEGKVDLMSNLRYSDERAASIHLMPYNPNFPESLFMLSNDSRYIENLTQLANLNLVTVRNYLYSPGLISVLDASQRRRHIEVDTVEAGLEMLLRGRADGIITPTISTLNAIEAASTYRHKFKIAPLDFSRGHSSYIYIGFSRNSPHAHLYPVIQQALQSMIDDGTITRLYKPVLDVRLLYNAKAPIQPVSALQPKDKPLH